MYKEKIENLIDVIRKSGEATAEEDVGYLEDAINACADYVDSVVQMESAITVARFRLEGEEFRETVERLDKTRRLNHNSAMCGLNMINRVAKVYGVKEIFEGVEDMDRIEIADNMIYVVVQEFFENRKK